MGEFAEACVDGCVDGRLEPDFYGAGKVQYIIVYYSSTAVSNLLLHSQSYSVQQ